MGGRYSSRRGFSREIAAECLQLRGDPMALPVLVGGFVSGHPRPSTYLYYRTPAEDLKLLWQGVLMGVEGSSDLDTLFQELQRTVAAEESARSLLEATDSGHLQTLALEALRAKRRDPKRGSRVRVLASACVWGVRRALELTGRAFEVRLIGGGAFGFTAPGEDVVHVNPVPLLRGDPDGETVLRALVLHELGHHLWHHGKGSREIWEEARNRGLGELLNLVADEHLERNLRSLDPRYGELLQALAAWAFQHGNRTVSVHDLLRFDGGRLLEPGSVRVAVARDDKAVRVDDGRLLLDLEAAGSSLARFVRALRMGLGDRHGDPKVAEGLALFRGPAFRHRTLAGLYEIAKELRRIFGEETKARIDLSLHSAIEMSESEVRIATGGLTDAELQEAIAEVLAEEERRSGRGSVRAGPRQRVPVDRRSRGGFDIDHSVDERFDRIERVEPLAYDPERARALAAEVRRWSGRLRERLLKLGTVTERQGCRTAGRRIDSLRLRRALLARDPRLLVRRRSVVHPDLFLGLAVDCSGSMEDSDKIVVARRFGALVADAARGVGGIDVRVLGFTDSTIYDVGTAERCAAHALEAGGGNNDAAALWHLSRLARASKRTARLLVMISDGMPTECSASALRALVHRLSGEGFGLVQVAVDEIPGENRCFPRCVEIDEEDLLSALRQFGRLVGTEVARVMIRR